MLQKRAMALSLIAHIMRIERISPSIYTLFMREKKPIAYSPVTGKIKKTYEFKPPTPKFFDGLNVERLIILESNACPDIHIRLLHIDSELKGGAFISMGDTLGTIVRSGFFDFWTAPHLHVEVRKNVNLIRAKGSEPILPIITEKKEEMIECPASPPLKLFLWKRTTIL